LVFGCRGNNRWSALFGNLRTGSAWRLWESDETPIHEICGLLEVLWKEGPAGNFEPLTLNLKRIPSAHCLLLTAQSALSLSNGSKGLLSMNSDRSLLILSLLFFLLFPLLELKQIVVYFLLRLAC